MPKSKTEKSRSVTTTTSIHSAIYPSVLNLLPDLPNFEDAPEISHLKIRRRSINSSRGSTDFEMVGNRGCSSKCKKMLASIFAKLMSFRKQESTGDELDDLDPVLPRTRHSLEFIRQLAEIKTIRPKSLAPPLQSPQISERRSQITATASSQSSASSTNLVIKRAYKAAFDGLTHLQQANGIFKQLILILTYTRYVDEPLTESNQSLTHGKTVIGSYAWILTYALQQLQDDPDVEINGYPAMDLKEVIRSMEQLVCQTVYLWNALTHTIETVERVHQRVETMFATIVTSFPQTAEFKVATTRHIKVYRKGQRREEELEKLKQYDANKSPQTWAQFSYAPLRILYKDERQNPESSWLGYDVLTTNAKLTLIKTVQYEINLIFNTVLNLLEKIDKLLHSNVGGTKADFATIRCFEDGVSVMGRLLEQLPEGAWTQQQIHDFLDVDKISLDNLDLLTVSTATVRTLLHEVRRIFHISYETTRDLDYLECKAMDPYGEVVAGVHRDFEAVGTKAKAGMDSSDKKRSIYDIEEQNLEMKAAAYQFERSIYQDILKELPVYCMDRVVGLTLQDAEAVFTESSHDLLSIAVHT